MARRTAHGAARDAGRLVVSECTPMDELRPGSNPDPVRKDHGPDGRFLPGNSHARLAKARAGVRGALLVLEAKADPAWRAARRYGRRAAAHRIREYGEAHGLDLSSGVCRMLSDAAQQSADAEYLSARAAADNSPELLRIAAQLRAGARQAERDAWALAELEAKSRKGKADPHKALLEAFGQPPASSAPALPTTSTTPAPSEAEPTAERNVAPAIDKAGDA